MDYSRNLTCKQTIGGPKLKKHTLKERKHFIYNWFLNSVAHVSKVCQTIYMLNKWITKRKNKITPNEKFRMFPLLSIIQHVRLNFLRSTVEKSGNHVRIKYSYVTLRNRTMYMYNCTFIYVERKKWMQCFYHIIYNCPTHTVIDVYPQ